MLIVCGVFVAVFPRLRPVFHGLQYEKVGWFHLYCRPEKAGWVVGTRLVYSWLCQYYIVPRISLIYLE